ncbi:unnamed protein product [Withania somnifera]
MNKMALCEQSSRLSRSLLPLPPNGGNSIPAVGCNERNYFSHNSSESSHFVEILHPHSSGGMNFTMRHPDVPPVKSLNPKFIIYYTSNPSANKFGRENEFCGPKFVASGKPRYHGITRKSADKGKMVISSPKPSLKFQSILRIQHMNQAGDLAKCQTRELCVKLPAPHLSTIETTVVHEAPSPRHSKLNIKSFVSSAPENRCGLVGDLNRYSDSNSESDEDYWIPHKREDATTNRCVSIMEGPSCSFLLHRDNHQSPKRVKSSYDCPEDQISGPPDVGGADRSEGISEASRQRIFAMQLFELHRLTKVQKMIARSPDILLKGNFYLHRPSIRFSSLKNLPCDDVLEPPVVAVENISAAPNNFENPVDNAYIHLRKDNDKKNIPQHSSQKPNVGTSTSRSFVSDPKLAPQCFQPPPVYHWLVPIRSPSEGLVYKPYKGPFYGNCRPVSLTPIGGDFANVPCSVPVPTSHKQGVGIFPGPAIFDQSCMQPYSMPVIKPSASKKENSPFMHDVKSVRPHELSCNISGQKSAVMSDFDRNFQVDRGSDIQGSTASSPPERAQKDAFSLFPITPTARGSDQPVQDNETEQRIRAIKVVPHNSKSASESAARVFRFMQEERKLNC